MFLTDNLLVQPRGSSHSDSQWKRRVSGGVCSLSLATVPYSESPGQAHLVLHSQAAVGAHTKARAVLRWDDPLDRRKSSRQSKRNLETLIPLQNMITRGLVVDKGNGAPVHIPTLLRLHNHPKVCRLVWQGASDTAPASMPWYPVLAQAGRVSPCALA